MMSSGLAFSVLSSSASDSSRLPSRHSNVESSAIESEWLGSAAIAASASLRAASFSPFCRCTAARTESRSAELGFFASPGSMVSSAWSGTPPNTIMRPRRARAFTWFSSSARA